MREPIHELPGARTGVLGGAEPHHPTSVVLERLIQNAPADWRVAERRVATDKLATMLKRIIPALRYLERFIRPRWPTPFELTKRVIGGFVLMLGVCLLAPLPLSTFPIGLTIVLVAFAYLEEDGILLALALAIALGLFGIGRSGAMEHSCGGGLAGQVSTARTRC